MRRACILAGLATAGLAAAAAGPAAAAPREVLPDLLQLPPTDLQVKPVDGIWRLSFTSTAQDSNAPGVGYLRIHGHGPGDGTMIADQIVQLDDGNTVTYPGVGRLQYVALASIGGHNHWHLLDFMHYVLRSAGRSKAVIRDRKVGFCLVGPWTPDCGGGGSKLTEIEMGLAPGGLDQYHPYLEFQDLPIDPVNTPNGEYVLVHRVNESGSLHESDMTNNASSVRIRLRWDATGTPSFLLLNSCRGSAQCEAMTRKTALQLARRAIRQAQKRTPRALRLSCRRATSARFLCRARWRTTGGRVWSGRVGVWYRYPKGARAWYYNVTAVDRASGQRVRKLGVRGGTAPIR